MGNKCWSLLLMLSSSLMFSTSATAGAEYLMCRNKSTMGYVAESVHDRPVLCEVDYEGNAKIKKTLSELYDEGWRIAGFSGVQNTYNYLLIREDKK